MHPEIPSQLRRLQAADLEPVLVLERAAHSYPWSESQLRSALGRYHCWGLWDGDRCLGFAVISCVLGEAELLDFAVHPDLQGRGLGSRFLAWLQAWLVNDVAAERFYLEVRAGNARALALYERSGFVEVGLRRAYYPARTGREDAILMACSLDTGH